MSENTVGLVVNDQKGKRKTKKTKFRTFKASAKTKITKKVANKTVVNIKDRPPLVTINFENGEESMVFESDESDEEEDVVEKIEEDSIISKEKAEEDKEEADKEEDTVEKEDDDMEGEDDDESEDDSWFDDEEYDDDDDDDDDDKSMDDDPYLTQFLKENLEPLHLENAMRIAVGLVFTNCFNNEPDVSKWKGKGGIRSQIRTKLGLGKNTKVDRILKNVLACKKEGVTYSGKRIRNEGRPPIIDLKSYEAQIIADCVESGFSIPYAWTVVNQYRKESNLHSLTLSPVRSCVKRLRPLIRKFVKKRQGNYDVDSAWCKARCNWDTQILIRTGQLTGKDLDYLKINGELPDWFNIEKMVPLTREQIAFWDETHKKCTIGGQGNSSEFYARFPRDAEGKLDVKNGTYDDTPITILNVKYEKEVRLCLGCAIVTNNDNVQVGKMAETFDYSGKVIKSIEDFRILKKNLDDEIRKSKNTKRWTSSSRIEGEIYESEDVTVLENIAEKTKEKLLHHNITTVGDIKQLTDRQIELIDDSANKQMRLSSTKLKSFRKQAATALSGTPPAVIDHRKADNPWLSKYGEGWEARQRKSSSLRSYVCITEMIEHIIEASAKLYLGTKYQDSWVFYHDALTLMTAKSTIEWMKLNKYYKRWLLPVNGLQTDDKSLKTYIGRPIGNCPENMPLDCSLNHDIHEGVKRHVVATWELSEDCNEKFSMSSPVRGASAYARVLTNIPSSKRIVEDILNVFTSMELVRLAKGKLVDSLTKNYGKRYELKAEGQKQKMGGWRERKLALDDYGGSNKWIHPDAKACVDKKLKQSRARREGVIGTKAIKDKMLSTT